MITVYNEIYYYLILIGYFSLFLIISINNNLHHRLAFKEK